jgi:membrane-bound serine protease (ClpP class)
MRRIPLSFLTVSCWLLPAAALAQGGPVDPGWAVQLAHVLAHPVVSAVLLALGILGLLTELKAGAHGLGVLASFFALGLFFGASLLLGLSGMGTILLLGLGLLLLGVELFLLPGHGITGILGSVLIAGSMVLAMLGPSPSPGDVVSAVAVLGASLVITGSVGYAFLRHLPTSSRFGALILKESTGAARGYLAAPARDDLIGKEGVASTDLRPAGVATVMNERIDVVTEGEYIPIGSKVRIVRADGYRHVVRSAG